mgnify:CR=1 FL=1|jgi:hypothetical protein
MSDILKMVCQTLFRLRACKVLIYNKFMMSDISYILIIKIVQLPIFLTGNYLLLKI